MLHLNLVYAPLPILIQATFAQDVCKDAFNVHQSLLALLVIWEITGSWIIRQTIALAPKDTTLTL